MGLAGLTLTRIYLLLPSIELSKAPHIQRSQNLAQQVLAEA